MPTGLTDSDADIQIRGKTIDSQKEITRLQRRLDIAKGTIVALNGKISDLEKQGLKLAKSLGFDSVYAAQASIDIADEPILYKELAEQIEGLQTDLLRERKDNERLRAQIQELQAENGGLKAELDSSTIISNMNGSLNATVSSSIQRQLTVLQRRYDELQAVKLRAEEKYKADYRKFNTLKAYIRSEEVQDLEAQLKADYPQLTHDDRKRRRAEIAVLLQKKMQEVEAAENSKEEMGGEDANLGSRSDKENQKKLVPETPRRRISCSPLPRSSPIGAILNPSTQVQPVALQAAAPSFLNTTMAPSLLNMTMASSSRTLVASARGPLHLQPINNGVTNQQLTRPPPGSLTLDGVILIPNSSDTEESPHPGSDRLASLKINSTTAAPRRPDSMSSETEEDSSQEPFPLFKVPPKPVKAPPPTQEDRKPLVMTRFTSPPLKPRLSGRSTLSPRPGSLQLVQQRSKSKTRHSDGGINTSTSPSWSPLITDQERPLKKRRVSSPGPSRTSARDISIGEPGASSATPLYVGSGDTPRRRRDRNRDRSASTGRKLNATAKDEGKGKRRELPKMETSTPVANARAGSSKQLADYSVYKGRGRYANAGGNTTINAHFAIDPEQNGGKDFQYHEVVRTREDRRHMEGGDCECCRDYYDAVGPMPPRLKAPLWRTPPSSPRGSKGTGSARKESTDITSHKNTISRHRERWTKPTTPPSYWAIGFPSTQDVLEINEKAQEMHREKLKNVQEEADRDGGRFKKR